MDGVRKEIVKNAMKEISVEGDENQIREQLSSNRWLGLPPWDQPFQNHKGAGNQEKGQCHAYSIAVLMYTSNI